MKIKIHVTKEVLRETMMCTTKHAISNCAIAFGVRKLFPTAVVSRLYIAIDPEFIPHTEGCWKQDFSKNIFLPQVATDFIDAFDKTSPTERTLMEPFDFEIDVQSSIIDRIGIGEAYRILSESKTLELVSIN